MVQYAMMERELYIVRGEEQLGPYTSTEIQTFANDGLIGQTDQLWNSTSQSYESFPASSQMVAQQSAAYEPAQQVVQQQPAQHVVQQPAQPQQTTQHVVQQPAQPQQTIIVQQQPSGTATVAAWICFILGFITQVTVIGLLIAPLFYLVSFILSIVMMAQGRAGGGITLLILNLIVPTVLGIIQFVLFGVTLSAATGAAGDL